MFASSNQNSLKQNDNVPIIRPPVHLGFLVSFLVDARGGSMRGCRHSGVRVIVPPKACTQPTRITCRYVKPQRVHNSPPLMEGEALVSRIMELSPVEGKFLRPVVLEVPHFGSLRDKEREIIILRSDNGDSWREHTLFDSDEVMLDVLQETANGELNSMEDLHTSRIVRIVTLTFPHFFAVVSRIRQEVHAIGPDGGTVSSEAVPQVQAIFPPNALTKKIRVGLQAQPVDLNGCSKLLGQGVAVSPVVTVEPRRRKFHKAITLSIPAPKASTQGMVNSPYTGNAPTLRLLCSITGGQNHAVWEDVTGSTPFAFVKDSITFTTTVSARFWLMDCRNISEASRMATELYSYMAQIPFMVKFVVFAKRVSLNEAKISVFCMTDDKEDKTLEQQEYFTEIAKSRDVEVLGDQDIYLEFAGNLVPVLKSGEQFNLKFQAFRENRLSFIVHVKDQEEPYGRISFMNNPKVSIREPPQEPICVLNISLEGSDIVDNVNRFNCSQKCLNNITVDPGLNYKDLLNAGFKITELKLANDLDGSLDIREGLNQINVLQILAKGDNTLHRADIRLSDVCNFINDDWIRLAKELGVPETDYEVINAEYTESPSQKAMIMLRLWVRQQGLKATGNRLEHALRNINRPDIVDKCIFNMEPVTDDIEKNMAKTTLDRLLFSGQKSPKNCILKQNEIYGYHKVNDETVSAEIAEGISANGSSRKMNSLTPNNISQLIQTNYDINNIRRIAEEHVVQILEEAQKNIEGDGSSGSITQRSNVTSPVQIVKGNGDGWKAGTTETQNISANDDNVLPMFKQHQQEHVGQPDDALIHHIIDRTSNINVIPNLYEGVNSTTHNRSDRHENPLFLDIEVSKQNPKDALIEDCMGKINKLPVGALDKVSSSILASVNNGNESTVNSSITIKENRSNIFEHQ